MAQQVRSAVNAEPIEDKYLSPLDSFSARLFSPPAALQPFITTLYSLNAQQERVRDVMPAAVGYLLFFLSGSGTARFSDGREQPSAPVTLLGPTSAATMVDLAGPLRIVGAVLSPLGWAALTGLDASLHRDTASDAAILLGPRIAAFGEELRRSNGDDEALAEKIAEFIAAHLRPIPPRHLELLVAVREWLSSGYNPPLEALQERAGYSGRQLQRLIERYFGSTPKQLVRKYRALRVGALLQDPASSDEAVAAALNHFYDQSHAIREIRHFMGRTPARLGDGSAPLLEAASALSNYYTLRPNVARMPGD